MHAFPLVSVSGTAYEMGFQHGQQAGDLIRKYLLWIEKSTGRTRAELGRNARAFERFIQRLNPRYLDEVRGLAAGAGLSYEEALLCQVRGEAANPHLDGCTAFALTGASTASGQPLAGQHAGTTLSEGCTAFALTGAATAGGQPIAGQNQDLPPEFSDLGIVLHLKPSDGRPRAITFTFAGQLGYMGMNQHGVAHFANALYNAAWRPGLPHYPLKRTLLELRSVAECLHMVEEHRTCSAGNMVFCDGEGAVADLEIRPEAVAHYPDEHPDCRLHTNHYLTPEFSPHEDSTLPDSCPRLDRLRELVRARWGNIDVAAMKEIMADHQGDPGGICRHGAKGSYSITGYLAEPAKGLFHVRRGHGCTGTWTSYEV
jgi:isopenicillin-N N-acyltransferase-like protein